MKGLLFLSLATIASITAAASSWGFDEASLSITSKARGSAGANKEKLTQGQKLSKPQELKPEDNLKIILTTKEGGKARLPHQTFLNLHDANTNLETSFPFQMKESGKGKLELSQKDIPTQLLSSSNPITASLFIASFGSSKPLKAPIFDVQFEGDAGNPLLQADTPLRYGKLPEIHHTFKPDPTSPPKIITLVFTAAVVATLPALIVFWITLGANVNHLPQALNDAPVPHTLFFLSIIALEGVFFLYYTHWKLFQVLPSALGIGLVTFLSGSRALREVQKRRLDRAR